MNLVFGIIMATTLTLVGLKFANKYYLKRNFFDNLTNFLEYLHSNLSFQNDDAFCTFQKYPNKNSDLNSILSIYTKENSNNRVDIATQIEKIKYLSTNDYMQLIDFFNNFGTVDKDTQLQHINSMLIWSRNRQNFCNAECLQKGKMYKTLSVMLGLVVLVIYI